MLTSAVYIGLLRGGFCNYYYWGCDNGESVQRQAQAQALADADAALAREAAAEMNAAPAEGDDDTVRTAGVRVPANLACVTTMVQHLGSSGVCKASTEAQSRTHPHAPAHHRRERIR